MLVPVATLWLSLLVSHKLTSALAYFCRWWDKGKCKPSLSWVGNCSAGLLWSTQQSWLLHQNELQGILSAAPHIKPLAGLLGFAAALVANCPTVQWRRAGKGLVLKLQWCWSVFPHLSSLSHSQATFLNSCLQKGPASLWLMPTYASDYLFLLLPPPLKTVVCVQLRESSQRKYRAVLGSCWFSPVGPDCNK